MLSAFLRKDVSAVNDSILSQLANANKCQVLWHILQ